MIYLLSPLERKVLQCLGRSFRGRWRPKLNANTVKTFKILGCTVTLDYSFLLDMGLIALILGVVWSLNLFNQPLLVPDSARYAEIPREMLVSGDWITPHLNGVKYFEKPPLFYWLQLIAFKIFGVSANVAMIPNLILSIGVVLETYYLGRHAFTRAKAITSALVLATSLMCFVFTRVLTLDVLLTFCVTLAIGGFWLYHLTSLKRHLYLGYLGVALGMLSKGLVGALLPGIVIFSFFIFIKRLKIFKFLYVPGILLALLIILPWHLAVQHLNPEFNYFYFVEQHLARFFTDYAQRQQPVWFFPVVFIVGWYPWIVVLPILVHHQIVNAKYYFKKFRFNLAKYPESLARCLFLIVWPTLIVTFFSLSQSKLIPYILPAWPPVALLIGNYLVNIGRARSRRFVFSKLLTYLNFGLMLAFIFSSQSRLAQIDLNIWAVTIWGCVIIGMHWLRASYILRSFNVYSFLIAGLITIPVYLGIGPLIPIFNNQSNFKLVKPLQQELKRFDTVIAYNDYFQDLPFYLNRTMVVAGDGGELNFGAAHQMDAKKWMWPIEHFNQCMQLKLAGKTAKLNASQCTISPKNNYYYIVTKQRNLQLLYNKWPQLKTWRKVTEIKGKSLERRVVITDKPL